MTPPRDSHSGYDSFWAATPDRGPQPTDPADVYAAFAAAAEGA